MENWSPAVDPTFRRGQCEFYTWPGPHGTMIGIDSICEQGPSQKRHLFRDIIPTQDSQKEVGRTVLECLKEINESAAELFELKPDLIEGMTLRFLSGESIEPSQTYTALSYCWPELGSDSINSSPPLQGLVRIPLSGLLFQHLVLQRETADEGIWCDQLCIDQDNKEEKNRTIAAMDAIYSCARVVIVALEDIEVSIEEQEFLQQFIQDYEDPQWPLFPPPHVLDVPAFMETNPIFLHFFYKLCRSRWFTRAWCSHEMRLAQRHRFMVRCGTADNVEATKLLTFSDFFLSYMCLLSSKMMIPEDIETTRVAIERVFQYSSYLDKLRQIVQNEPAKDASGRVLSYTAQILEIFSLGAGGDPNAVDRARDANLDRITIVLNSMGNGIGLKRELAATSPFTSSPEQCKRLLLTVALAAGDPTALCTLGMPFRLGGAKDSSSWLCAPHFADVGSGAQRQEQVSLMDNPRFRLDTGPLNEWIELDILLLGEPERPPQELIDLARMLIEKCKDLNLGGGHFGLMGVGPAYESWRAEADDPELSYSFVITVAIILWCGPQWMLGAAEQCGFADPQLVKGLETIVTANFSHGFNHNDLTSSEWVQSPGHQKAVNSILRVAHWMKSWSTLSLDRNERINWFPMVWSRGWANKVMGFVPTDAVPLPVVPIALLKCDYARFSRVWLLQLTGNPMMDEALLDKSPRMFLRGKSILFGAALEPEYVAQTQSRYCAQGFRVHGYV